MGIAPKATLFFAMLLFLWGCDATVPTSNLGSFEEESSTTIVTETWDPEQVNHALDDLAKALAHAVRDVEVRETLQEQLALRFDGSPAALYETLQGRSMNEGSFDQVLARSYAVRHMGISGTPSKSVLVDAKAATQSRVAVVPRLNVAVPRNFDQWRSGEFIPLVAYTPEGIDEMDLKEIKAYDVDGNVHMLSSEVAPTVPVIVLGVSERVDDEGNVHEGLLTDKLVVGGGGGGSGGGSTNPYLSSRSSGNAEYIRQVKIINDYERWHNEPAEIRVKVLMPSLGGEIVDQFIGDPEPEDRFHTINKRLFRWYFNNYDNYAVLVWYEHDNDNKSISFNFGFRDPTSGLSTSFSYSLTNDDDPMGRAIVDRRDPLSDIYGTGDVSWQQGTRAN